MKTIFLLIVAALLSVNLFAQYPSLNISMYALWDSAAIPAEPFFGIRYNGCWGWVDTTDNREYGIIGSTEGIHFVDITNPSAPVQRDFVAGRRNQCIWREMKTYQNYLYAVSDDAAPNSMQIIDMSYLPDSVHVVYDNDTLVQRAHTMWIDGNKMYLASPKTISGISYMGVYSLASPTNPTLIRMLEKDYLLPNYVHDMFVRNDTVYVSDGFSGLYLFKFTGTSFLSIGSLTSYTQQGYNHSSSLTGNGKTLIFCDEVPSGLAVKSLDVSDFSNLTVLDTFISSPTGTATPHNPFVIGNSRVVIAYYNDGVQIFDISNPSNVTRTGYFDTRPTDSSGNYAGCWGAYPYFPSGVMIASDMQKGMFILNPSNALTGISSLPISNASIVNVMPNPVKSNLSISFSLKENENVLLRIFDLSGRKIYERKKLTYQGVSEEKINVENLSEGIYILKITGETFSSSYKISKIN